MADRGYLGCSYSWCIINVGLTWPSRSTRIRRIAQRSGRPRMVLTRIPFIYACAPEAFSRIRGGPGLVVPSAYDPRNHGPSLSLSLSFSIPSPLGSGELLRANGCTKLVSSDIRPSALFSGFYRRRNSSCFIPPAFHRAGIKERLIYFNRAISEGSRCFPSYLSLSNTRILWH